MSSSEMDQSTNSELAHAIAQDILGPGWFALSCGCLLSVQCRLPGSSGYINLLGWGHRVCQQHDQTRDDDFFASFGPNTRWKEAPMTWMHWYSPDPHRPGPVTQAQFQSAFDDWELPLAFKATIKRDEERENWIRHPSERWVFSQGGTHKIYRTGAVIDDTGVEDAH